MPKVAPPPKTISWNTWLMHVFSVILGLVAVKMIEGSPHPSLGVVVLALVLSFELPVAGWNLLRAFWLR
jgi:hypothetical protein